MLINDYIGSLFVFFIIAISNIGGTGGGGIIIPTAAIFFKFDTKNGIALSKISAFFSVIIRYFIHFKKKHPLKQWSVAIDYNYSIIILPSVIIGVTIG